jgi:hypothetical protein
MAMPSAKPTTPAGVSSPLQRQATERLIARVVTGSSVPRTVTFSPGRRHVAYVLKADNRRAVVVDGISGKPYDDIGVGELYFQQRKPVFSPDSQHILYGAASGAQMFVVVDGVRSKFAAITTLYSPDSRHIAFESYRGSAEHFVVLDEQEQGNGAMVSEREVVQYEFVC